MNTRLKLQEMFEELPRKLQEYFRSSFVDYHLRKIGKSEVDWNDYEFHKRAISNLCINSREYNSGINYLVEVLEI